MPSPVVRATRRIPCAAPSAQVSSARDVTVSKAVAVVRSRARGAGLECSLTRARDEPKLGSLPVGRPTYSVLRYSTKSCFCAAESLRARTRS